MTIDYDELADAYLRALIGRVADTPPGVLSFTLLDRIETLLGLSIGDSRNVDQATCRVCGCTDTAACEGGVEDAPDDATHVDLDEDQPGIDELVARDVAPPEPAKRTHNVSAAGRERMVESARRTVAFVNERRRSATKTDGRWYCNLCSEEFTRDHTCREGRALASIPTAPPVDAADVADLAECGATLHDHGTTHTCRMSPDHQGDHDWPAALQKLETSARPAVLPPPKLPGLTPKQAALAQAVWDENTAAPPKSRGGVFDDDPARVVTA